MAPHLVLSRKYRPQTFQDLVGQEAVAQTLRNAITSGRIGHAYLFVGPRGTGKTTTARIFARALNCESGPTPDPCGTCATCRDVALGVDLDVVEMDAASNNGVDDVRALRDSVGYHPARARYRIWIVDEVHMLSLPAFNAFLKTLEEPPPQAKFVFCTTEAHKLPETFTSRCQRLEFRRIDEAKMAERLQALAALEGVEVEPGVCARIAAGALGGLRDAESLLEQLLACAADGRVTVADLDAVLGRAPAERVEEWLGALERDDAAASLEAASACLGTGSKPDVLLDQVLEAFRGMLAEAAAAPRGPRDVAAGRGARLGLPRVARSLDLLLEKRRHLREGADGRLVLEVAAVELARLPSAHDLDALIRALRAGEAAPPAGAAPSGGTGRSASALGTAPQPAAPSRPSGPTASGGGSGSGSWAQASPGCAAPVRSGAGPASGIGSGVGSGIGSGPAVSLDDLVARWDEVLRGVESRSRRLHACLVRARPCSVQGDAVVLALPDTETVARAILRDRDAGEAFREATREAFGSALRPVVADGVAAAAVSRPPRAAPSGGAGPARAAPAAGSASAGAAPAASAPDRAEDVRGSPLVRAVLDGFGARLLSVERFEAPSGTAGAPPGTPS